MNFFMKHWAVLMRCALYFFIAFIPTTLGDIQSTLKINEWPSPQALILSLSFGFLSGLIAVRAYFDGSAERHTQKLDTEKHETTTPVNAGS